MNGINPNFMIAGLNQGSTKDEDSLRTNVPAAARTGPSTATLSNLDVSRITSAERTEQDPRDKMRS